MNFAEKLMEARSAAGMTRQGMADRMLIPRSKIIKWETGKRVPLPFIQRFVLNKLKDIAQNERSDEYALDPESYREELREMRKNGARKLRYLSDEQRKEIEERRAAGENLEDIFNSMREKKQ